MNKQIQKWLFGITALALIAGIALSLVAWSGICSEACAQTHFYRMFNLPFEPIGLAFFGSALVAHLMSRSRPWLGTVVGLMVFGALGSEIRFILVQKYEIGSWCPICLSIAASVALAALCLTGTFWLHFQNLIKEGNHTMLLQQTRKGVASFFCIAIGFVVALVGVFKPDHSFAAMGDVNQDPRFGNKESVVEVYVVTDWFCPACHRAAPILEKMYPAIMKKATLVFIDWAVHPESLNYTPYNLSFMVKEKEKYFEIRNILTQLTQKTKTPTTDQVQAAVASLGVKYQPLNYSDVESGIHYFEGIVKNFSVTSTPTLVIANRKKIQARKISGGEITEANVTRVIDEMLHQ